MIKEIDHFNMKEIAESGQCFRWKEISEGEIAAVAFGRVLHIKKVNNSYDFSCTESEWENIWAPYFDVKTDYNKVESLVRASGDSHLLECFEKGSGIRILNQDLFETIISFLISQNNNIGRIKKSVETICRLAGNKIEGEEEYSFPGPFDVDEDFFRKNECGLGYRVPYLEEMYAFVRENPDWLNRLKTLSYGEARTELMKRKGIGPKVADCICLFSLHHIDAFPIDTHVKALLNKYYKDGFDYGYFEGVCGIIQQYLFYYEIA